MNSPFPVKYLINNGLVVDRHPISGHFVRDAWQLYIRPRHGSGTLLSITAESETWDIVKSLVEEGADLAVQRQSITGLMMAAQTYIISNKFMSSGRLVCGPVRLMCVAADDGMRPKSRESDVRERRAHAFT